MNEILQEVRLSFDGDAFGTVQEWRFALCDYLTFVLGEGVPNFQAAPFGADEESYAYQILLELQPIRGEAYYALDVLNRAREIIHVEGLDY